MGLFCLPLSSCYTMVDIYLQSLQPQQVTETPPNLLSGNATGNGTESSPGDTIIMNANNFFFKGDTTASNFPLIKNLTCLGDLYNNNNTNTNNSCVQNDLTMNGLLPFIDNDDLMMDVGIISTDDDGGDAEVYLFDDANAYWFQVVWICLLHNVLIMVGLVGNVFNIIVLSRKGIGARTTNILLMALAAIDCVLLLSSGIQNMTCFTCYLEPARALYIDTVTNIYLTSPSRWISFVNLDITALIAVERAIAVFLPFKVGELFTSKTVVVFFVCILAIVVVVIVPHMILVRPLWQFDPVLNETVANTFYFTGEFTHYLVFWSLVENLNAIGCIVIISVCGSATAIKLIHQARSRTFMTNNQRPLAVVRQERRAVIMVLIVCFISFLVHLPNSLNQLYSSFFLEQLAADGLYCALRALGSFLGAVNAAVNFFIYFFMSSRFREGYKILMCWK